MTCLNEQGRPEPPVAGDETATLLGSLERQRATLAWKCGGDSTRPEGEGRCLVDHAGRSAQAPGLVEDYTFSQKLLGQDPGPRGTRWTGTLTPTGTGTRPPRTP
jgi:hypothetical protein